MRRVYGFLTVIVVLILVDFTLWFLHTRTITNAISSIKEKAALYDIELEYDDLQFTTFKFWDVKAVLVNPSLSINQKEINSKILLSVPKVNISSLPLSSEVSLNVVDNISSVVTSDGVQEQVYQLSYKKYPELKISFDLSFFDFLEGDGLLKDSYIDLVKTVEYSDEGYSSIDMLTKKTYASSDSQSLRIARNFDADHDKVNFQLLAKGYEYSAETAGFEKNKSVDYGKGGADIDVVITKHFDNSGVNSAKSLGQDKVIKEYVVDMKRFEVSWQNSGLSITGAFNNMVKKSTFEMDVILNITNYKTFIDAYVEMLNAIVLDHSSRNSMLPKMNISARDKQYIKNAIRDVFGADDDLKLHIVKAENGIPVINGKPFFEILQQFINNKKDIK